MINLDTTKTSANSLVKRAINLNETLKNSSNVNLNKCSKMLVL